MTTRAGPRTDETPGTDETLRDLAAVVDRVGGEGVARARSVRDAGGAVDRAMWARFGGLGWLSLGLPEALGGAGAGERAVATVAERLGARAFPEPYCAAGVLVTGVLAPLAGRPAARRVLDRVAAGELLATLAGAPDTPGPTLREDGAGGHVLDGRVRWVPVPDADTVLVAAGDALVEVGRTALGVGLTRVPLADGGALADLHLRGVAVPAGALLACGPPVAAALRSGHDAALVAVSAELTGIAGRALEATCDHLREREQFGRPIGSFQALQHRAVDMWVQVRLARAALEGALAVRERPGASADERSAAASSAKARASDAATWVCRQAVQLHGAIGFSDEHDLGHYVNGALVLSTWLGDGGTHRLRHDALTRMSAGRR